MKPRRARESLLFFRHHLVSLLSTRLQRLHQHFSTALHSSTMSAPGKLQDNEVYLASYLIERLIQLGVNVMYGVPGDFNLVFLDEVEAHPRFGWIGCCNELNAGYAADGYARVKQVSTRVQWAQWM